VTFTKFPLSHAKTTPNCASRSTSIDTKTVPLYNYPPWRIWVQYQSPNKEPHPLKLSRSATTQHNSTGRNMDCDLHGNKLGSVTAELYTWTLCVEYETHLNVFNFKPFFRFEIIIKINWDFVFIYWSCLLHFTYIIYCIVSFYFLWVPQVYLCSVMRSTKFDFKSPKFFSFHTEICLKTARCNEWENWTSNLKFLTLCYNDVTDTSHGKFVSKFSAVWNTH